MKNEKNVLPLILQLFAEDNNNGDNGSENNNQESGEKTFTQSQVSSMMAKEKSEGKRSILKTLGFNCEEDAMTAMKELKEFKDNQKTKEELLNDNIKNANSDKDKAIARAEYAEQKLSCLSAGVNSDSLDDVLAIAKLKVSDDKNLDKVLEEMKSESRYCSFFKSNNSSNSGTGSTPGHSGNNDDSFKAGDYGKQLAERNSSKSNSKKSYFS